MLIAHEQIPGNFSSVVDRVGRFEAVSIEIKIFLLRTYISMLKNIKWLVENIKCNLCFNHHQKWPIHALWNFVKLASWVAIKYFVCFSIVGKLIVIFCHKKADVEILSDVRIVTIFLIVAAKPNAKWGPRAWLVNRILLSTQSKDQQKKCVDYNCTKHVMLSFINVRHFNEFLPLPTLRLNWNL